MGLSLEKIRNGISDGISQHKLGFGSIDDIRSGSEDFQFGGIVRGSLDFVIYNISILFHTAEIKSIEVHQIKNFDFQTSNLEEFCVRIQALRPDGLLVGGYVGRIGNYDYAGFGFGLAVGENVEAQIKSNDENPNEEISIPIANKDSVAMVKTIVETNEENLPSDQIITKLVSLGGSIIPAIHEALTDGSVCEHSILVDALAELSNENLLAYQIVNMIADHILPVNDPNAFKSAFRVIAINPTPPESSAITEENNQFADSNLIKEIKCPGCSEIYKITKNILDKKVACPCGTTFNVTIDGKIVGQNLSANTKVLTKKDINVQVANTISCPYCAEAIQFNAKKCKHCGEWLTENEPKAMKAEGSKSEENELVEPYKVEKPKYDEAGLSVLLGGASFVLGPITGIPAIIYGHISISKINQSNGAVVGKEKALIGLVLGYFTTLIFGVVMVLVIPAFIKGQFGNSNSQLSEAETRHNIMELRRKELERSKKNSEILVDSILPGGKSLTPTILMSPATQEKMMGEWEHIAFANVTGDNEINTVTTAPYSILKDQMKGSSATSLVEIKLNIMISCSFVKNLPVITREEISILENTITLSNDDGSYIVFTGEIKLKNGFQKVLILKKTSEIENLIPNSSLYISRGASNPFHNGLWTSLSPMKEFEENIK
ncbi:MAG: hypothetical protein COA79_03715 [Planctomycetota bacterium]|nr:MAG: hypothetical protein COA79_03715 [Planctomycetota bacterium]